eukprot:GHRQ01024509.1.p1 GENE.GHRQ01024509.1~~GHRQ01024509.1.p1  ORF type:complete len:112 (+),score=17.30 GHRQ01024509.1:860-1195(+)
MHRLQVLVVAATAAAFAACTEARVSSGIVSNAAPAAVFAASAPAVAAAPPVTRLGLCLCGFAALLLHASAGLLAPVLQRGVSLHTGLVLLSNRDCCWQCNRALCFLGPCMA